MKSLLILNPNAGNGELLANTPAIINYFNENGFQLEVMLTTRKHDATYYAEKYGVGRKLVICAGGDGTLNETVNGVMRIPESERPCVGYIPCGTTNDFAKSLRIPMDPIEAARNIVEGSIIPYDIGCFNGKFFVYIVACGAFSATSYEASQDLKRVFGQLAYVFEGVKELPAIKPHHMKFEFGDGEVLEGNYAFGAISNARNYGGIVSLEKLGVDVSDGLFEMTLVKLPKDFIETGKVAYSLGSGNYDKNLITFERFSSCKITVFSEELNWSVDGEKSGHNDVIDVSIMPRAINFIIKENKYDIPTDIQD